MKLHEVAVDRPIIIDLAMQRIGKNEPVFFTLVGDKARKKQKRVVEIGMNPEMEDGINRYTITYVDYDQNPAAPGAGKGQVGVSDLHFGVAELVKQKDGAWLLDIPNTPFERLKAA